MWTAWTHFNFKHIRIIVLLIFILLSVPSYTKTASAMSDVIKPYSSSAGCANYIKKYLPDEALYIETSTADFTALRPYLPDSFEAYSIVTGENDKFTTWQEKEPLIDSIDKLEELVANKAPHCKDFYIILSSDSSGPISEWFFANGSQFIVYNSIDESIVHEDYAILHVNFPFLSRK